MTIVFALSSNPEIARPHQHAIPYVDISVFVSLDLDQLTFLSKLAQYGETTLQKINTGADLDRVHNFVQYAFTRAAPQEVYYFNYHVGECKDLVFGVSLVDYATARNRPNDPPSIVKKAIDQIEARGACCQTAGIRSRYAQVTHFIIGMDSEGIYRVSGRHAALQEVDVLSRRTVLCC